jgi:hypothetical protein
LRLEALGGRVEQRGGEGRFVIRRSWRSWTCTMRS